MIEDIVNTIIFGLEWGVALTMLIGVMAWGVRSIIGLFQLTSHT